MPSVLDRQPFIAGRPVRPDEFLGHHDELSTVLRRLRNGESSAVVGLPKSGKTSILRQVSDQATLERFLGGDASKLIIHEIDLLPVPADYSPVSFWEEALKPIRDKPGHAAIRLKVEKAAEHRYRRGVLTPLFENLADRDRQLVLLLDEFDRLLVHPEFADPSFFALLRSLATRSGGLAVILTSQLSVEQMNERGRELLAASSPLFNYFIEVRLPPFAEEDVDLLLDRAREAFSESDRRFVRRVAGRHPFLLQAMGAALFEARGDERQSRATHTFYKGVGSHFAELWKALDDPTCTVALLLSLKELAGDALGERFDFKAIRRPEAFGPELEKLSELGIAERIGDGWRFNWKNVLNWRGQRWTMSAQAFAWWIRDEIIARTRDEQSYVEWLAANRYGVFLTQEQWERWTGVFRKTPDGPWPNVAELAQKLWEMCTG